jgi:predicted lipid-binding transport protein (Tim44 family)
MTARVLSLVVAIAVSWSVALAPLPAAAQSETPPAAPAQPAQQPDLYQEALKASQAPPRQNEAAYQTGAVVASAFSVPGRVILCGLGSGLTLATLLVTLGTGYSAAKSIFEEGCLGKWVVTPEDLRAANERTGLTPDPYIYGRQ